MKLTPLEAEMIRALNDLLVLLTVGPFDELVNPFSRPEIKAGLEAIAKAQGNEGWASAQLDHGKGEGAGLSELTGQHVGCEHTCANVARCEDDCVGYQEKEKG